MRGEKIRVEARLDGSLAFRYHGQYVSTVVCNEAPSQERPKSSTPVRKDHNRGGRSQWMSHFQLNHSPAVWQSLRAANASS